MFFSTELQCMLYVNHVWLCIHYVVSDTDIRVQALMQSFYSFSRFVVRDFVFDPGAVEAERQERSKLELLLKKQFVST